MIKTLISRISELTSTNVWYEICALGALMLIGVIIGLIIAHIYLFVYEYRKDDDEMLHANVDAAQIPLNGLDEKYLALDDVIRYLGYTKAILEVLEKSDCGLELTADRCEEYLADAKDTLISIGAEIDEITDNTYADNSDFM